MRRMGIFYFNRDPRKGVDWLMGRGILRDEAKDVAHFFHTEARTQSIYLFILHIRRYEIISMYMNPYNIDI